MTYIIVSVSVTYIIVTLSVTYIIVNVSVTYIIVSVSVTYIIVTVSVTYILYAVTKYTYINRWEKQMPYTTISSHLYKYSLSTSTELSTCYQLWQSVVRQQLFR